MTTDPSGLTNPDDGEELDPGPTPGAGDVDDDVDGTPPSDVDDGTPAEDPNLVSLRQKYPGKSDDEIFRIVGAAYWDQTKEISATVKRARDLELENATLKGRLEAGATPAEPPPPPQEIQAIDAEIHDLEQQDKDAFENHVQLLKDIGEAKDEASQIKGQIAAAKAAGDEDAVSRLETAFKVAEKDVKAIRRDLDRSMRERKQIGVQHGRLLRVRSETIKAIQEDQVRREEEQQEQQEILDAIPGAVDERITAHFNDPKAAVPKDASFREHLREYLRDKITIDMWKAGPKVRFDKLNVPSLIGQHTAAYLKAQKAASRSDFNDTSTRKTRVAGGPAPKAQDTKGQPATKKAPAGFSPTGAPLSEQMLAARRRLAAKGW